MKKYIFIQIKFIHKLAIHKHITDDEAGKIWIDSGLAEKFSILYRNLY